MSHPAIIGFGAIGQGLLSLLAEQPEGPVRITILVRPGKEAKARETAGALFPGPGLEVVTAPDALLARAPDVVVECAGHGAVDAHGAAVLGAGTDLIVASVGSLADDAMLERLREAARTGGAQLTVPAGAIGGIDALAAARLSGIGAVTYTGRKPPAAWAGSPAEDAVDLGALREETVFFEGTAREAARAYPKNANVAATLALAGIGMDRTRVRLVADPAARENTHEYRVRANAVDYSVRLAGKPSPLNPRTSQLTVLSLARAVLNRSAAIAV